MCLPPFAIIDLVKVLGEGIEAAGPEGAIGGQPVLDLPEGVRSQPIDASLRRDARLNQARIAQDAKVLRNRRLAHRQAADQVANRPLTGPKQVEDPPSIGLRQHLERRGHEPQYADLDI